MEALRRIGLNKVCLMAAALFMVACSDSDDETARDAGQGQAEAGGGERDAGGGEEDAGPSGTDSAVSSADAAATTDAAATSDAAASDAKAPADPNLVELAVADGRFTSLVAAVKKAGLVETLSGPGPLTVFAPTDAAFTAALAALGKTLDTLTADELKPILTYHVLSGAVRSTDLKAGPVKTVSGFSAFVSTTGGAKINGVSVVTADIAAKNGVIHVIDKVLLPPNLVQAATLAGDFSTLIGAVTSAGLAETLSKADANLTVFAPDNAAFAKLSAVPSGDALKNVLLYHVVSGKVLSTDLKAGMVPTLLTGKSVTVDLSAGVRINASKVVAADIVTTNGVIHVIDTVLIPPG
jgi:transforming growth factor-beta-induced protein